MLRLGMLDLDTSHAVAFTQRLNHLKVPEDQWVDGAQVVIACPGVSRIMPDRLEKFTKDVKELGIPLVEKPEAMLGKIDALLLEANDGSVHLERARPFLEAGLPVWIDKPLAWSVSDAEKIAELSAKHNAPVFSASSVRFAPEVVRLRAGDPEIGAPVSVQAYFAQNLKDNVPGWFFYGIHAVELLFGLLGGGFTQVSYTKGEGAEIASSPWKNGALGSAVSVARGHKPTAFTFVGEKGTRQAEIDGTYNYREMLKALVAFVKDRKSPVPIEETIETIRFVEAVNKAGGLH